MSLKQAPYYWLECDGLADDGTVCAEKSTENGEYGAWESAGSATDEATESEWVQHEGKDYCREHSYQFRCDDCAEVKEECVCEDKITDHTFQGVRGLAEPLEHEANPYRSNDE